MTRPANARARVRVYCNEPGAYHDRRPMTVLATYELVAARGDRPSYWLEVRATSTRTKRAYEAWFASLTDAEVAAIANGTNPETALTPFAGVGNVGLRPAATEFLRGNEPPGAGSHFVEEAINRGTRTDSIQTAPARPEDAAGRAKVPLACDCGLPGVLSARAEDVWGVFDMLAANRIRKISLKELIKQLDAPGAPHRH